MKRLVFILSFALLVVTVQAATLTPAQLQTLKTNIGASTDTVSSAAGVSCAGFVGTQVNAVPNSADGNICLAAVYNLAASPTFTVWKTNVGVTEIGDNINGTELAGLTNLNVTRLQAIIQLSPNGVNPSLADRRQFFDDVFSGAGGTTTRAQLLVLWKRTASRFEKLYATGTGSDPSPGTIVVAGPVTNSNVNDARALP